MYCTTVSSQGWPLDVNVKVAFCWSAITLASSSSKSAKRLTLVHVFGHFGLLILAVLHHVVDMAEDGVDGVFDRHVEGEERDDVLVLYLDRMSA